MLVHGASGGAWNWYKTLTALQHSGFKTSAVDLTSNGIDKTSSDNVTSLAQFAQPLTDYLGNVAGKVCHLIISQCSIRPFARIQESICNQTILFALCVCDSPLSPSCSPQLTFVVRVSCRTTGYTGRSQLGRGLNLLRHGDVSPQDYQSYICDSHHAQEQSECS